MVDSHLTEFGALHALVDALQQVVGYSQRRIMTLRVAAKGEKDEIQLAKIVGGLTEIREINLILAETLKNYGASSRG